MGSEWIYTDHVVRDLMAVERVRDGAGEPRNQRFLDDFISIMKKWKFNERSSKYCITDIPANTRRGPKRVGTVIGRYI